MSTTENLSALPETEIDPPADNDFAQQKANFLGYCARLWGGALREPDGDRPVEPHQYWGCVLSMGRTEGNVYAITPR
ncbi:hypothetical protein [Saccharothrix sp. Mg75]|uniref:hypothetical protein n=1 Tax=Saccharothrix sp. Mg75 TaxID=3445357 RepID=UPI003EECA2F3